MLGASNRFGNALSSSHLKVNRIDVHDVSGAKIASTWAGAATHFGVQAAGGVTNDATASIRRRCEFALLDTDGSLVPMLADDLFSNLSDNFVRIWQGIDYQDGTEPEMVKVGTFDIEQSVTSDTSAGRIIRVTGYDFSRRLQRAKLTAPYYVQENRNYIAAIESLVSDRLSVLGAGRRSLEGFTIINDGTSHVTPFITLNEQADPLAEAQKMATSIGKELYVSVDGDWLCFTTPDPDQGEVSWYYWEGAGALLLSTEDTSSNENVYSGVIVVGDSSSGYAPARAEVWDLNANSPTYVGRYGYVPKFVNDNLVLNDAQAWSEANSLFNKAKGVHRIVHFTVPWNPLHDFGDIIWVRREAARIDDTFALEAWTIPLGVSDTMPVSCRERVL